MRLRCRARSGPRRRGSFVSRFEFVIVKLGSPLTRLVCLIERDSGRFFASKFAHSVQAVDRGQPRQMPRRARGMKFGVEPASSFTRVETSGSLSRKVPKAHWHHIAADPAGHDAVVA